MSAWIDHVKSHFDREAGVFDERVVKIIPYYRDMLEALVAAIPRGKKEPVRVIDLGCGTGTVAWMVKYAFPNAAVTCVDLSRNMLELARVKLQGMSKIDFELAELGAYRFNRTYDAVVSSLALHHLEPGRRKNELFRKIFKALKRGGVFVNADIVLAADGRIQKTYLAKWAEYIARSYSPKEIRENYRRYKREDRPAVLTDEIGALKNASFRRVEVFWKRYNFAVYGGFR